MRPERSDSEHNQTNPPLDRQAVNMRLPSLGGSRNAARHRLLSQKDLSCVRLLPWQQPAALHR
jgi:hypothetical protein